MAEKCEENEDHPEIGPSLPREQRRIESTMLQSSTDERSRSSSIGVPVDGLPSVHHGQDSDRNPVSFTLNEALKDDYRRALELGVVLSAYARVMFVGPGGVGKSSLLRGLMNKSIHAISATSTQLADTLTVKPVSYQWLCGDGTFWKEVTDNDELMELVGLVHLVAKASVGEIKSPRFIEMMKETLSKAVRCHRQHPTSKEDPESVQRKIIHDILTQAVKIARKNPNATLPLIEVLLLSWDCGGQSVFLDILPAFLTPRTVFLSVFDARRKLTDPCLIQSFKSGEVVAKQYHNASTLELILEWMASIHAMLGTRESSDTIPKFPRIIPVGTHGDDLDVKAKKEEIIANLSAEYQDKAFAHLVKKGVIVDNTTAGEGENEDLSFEYIRQEVHDLASKELAVPTPVSWVLFRRVFQKVVKASDSPIVSLKLAKDIAIACNIPEESIPSMLQFYHDLAVFFHYTRVTSLKDRLIADPQWLVKEIAKLLALEGFESVNNPVLWKPLRERGVLVQPLYEEVWKGSKLPSQSLIDLLVYFKIAAPIVHKEYKFPGKEYYVPCVLPFFRAETTTPLQLAISGTAVTKHAAPLHLLFNTHHVPPGYFTRLAISLSTDPKCRVLLRHEAYCNRISILYGDPECRIDQITLTKSKFSVKIDLARFQPRQSHHLSFASTCREVLKLLQNNSLSVLEWFPGVSVHMGFSCEECPREEDKNEHFVDISPEMSTRSQLYCTEFKSCTLTNAHLHWLNVSTKMLSLKGVPPVPEDAELQKLASEIQSKDKFKDVTDALEMNYHLECVGEDDPDAPVEVLRQWCSDMEEKDVQVRSHLVQHLRTAGLKEVAEKIRAAKYRKPTESSESLKSHPQKFVTKRELMSCSKFISYKQIPVLAKALSITASEEAHILSEFKQPDQQVYQMLITWHTKAYNKSRQELLEVLEASDLHESAKQLQKASQVPEMADLIKYVKAAFKWYTLGTHLGVENHKLKVIQENNRNDSEAALLAVFQAWLDNTPDPSWSIVVKALYDTQLGVLASEISDRFCV